MLPLRQLLGLRLATGGRLAAICPLWTDLTPWQRFSWRNLERIGRLRFDSVEDSWPASGTRPFSSSLRRISS